MKRIIFIVFIALLASTSVSAYAQEFSQEIVQVSNIDEIDREMVELLTLNPAQAVAYSKIMQHQRQAFLALQADQWQAQLALYEETIEILKTVLNEHQHTQFITVLGCLIEETHSPEYLALE